MKKSFITILLLVFTVLLTNCQKELPEKYYIYAGDWGSKKYSIEIWENGKGSWEKKGIFGSCEKHDCRVEISDEYIKFFEGAIRTKKFTIDTKPTVDDESGRTYMILDGEKFFKH